LINWLSKYEKVILASASLLVGVFLFYLATISPGVEGGMDSYNHYLIAKNTWSHPYLFLDQWGKPIYNLMASPFVQFGMLGAVVFNIICLLLSAFFAYRISQKIAPKFAFIALLMTLFSPVFLDNIISSLTEPLSALLVTLSLFLLVNKRYSLAALLAGFLPFARSEGFIILGVILVFLLLKKEFRSISYILIGSTFFNTLGWIIEGEPFWIITKNPYISFALSGVNVCGSGGFSHFLYAGHYTFGQVTCILLVVATLFLAWDILKDGIKQHLELLLVLAVFISYFLAHVLIWWLGMMGSCGYIRVMTVIAPMVAILVSFALQKLVHLRLIQQLKNLKLYTNLFLLFLVINTIYVPYRYYAYKYPLAISAEQEQYVKVADWYEKKGLKNRTKIILYPYFSIIANIDPYDKNQLLEFWESSFQYSKKGDILFWDSHFGPNECNTPLARLEDDPQWKKIHSVIPGYKISTVNDVPFEIHVFEKIE
jgi:hypothetical protein